MALGRCGVVVINLVDVPVGIVVGCFVDDSVVANVVVVYILAHFAVSLLAAVLLLPLLGQRQQLVEIHAEEFNLVVVGIGLALQCSPELRWHVGEFG